jgi:hypothetical protein
MHTRFLGRKTQRKEKTARYTQVQVRSYYENGSYQKNIVRISTGLMCLSKTSSGGHIRYAFDNLRLKHMLTKFVGSDACSYLSNRFVKAYYTTNDQCLKLVNRASAPSVPCTPQLTAKSFWLFNEA